MAKQRAEAEWKGDLKSGSGAMKFGSHNLPYSFSSRFENGEGSNPEELIGAAHAGCFSMALAHKLAEAGFKPNRVHTHAEVFLEKAAAGFAISRINLATDADVPGIDEPKFHLFAEETKQTCPVSRALAGVHISLDAKLVAGAPAR